jgi:hypothetical protein
MKAADMDKAHALIAKERAAAKLNPDINIFKIDYVLPLTVEECFLSSSENMFDVEAAKRQKAKLQINAHTEHQLFCMTMVMELNIPSQINYLLQISL